MPAVLNSEHDEYDSPVLSCTGHVLANATPPMVRVSNRQSSVREARSLTAARAEEAAARQCSQMYTTRRYLANQ